MKSTGIVRRVDELGRIVLPSELRRTLNIGVQDPLEIYVEGTAIVMRKVRCTCAFCGGSRELVAYREKRVCHRCLQELRQLE